MSFTAIFAFHCIIAAIFAANTVIAVVFGDLRLSVACFGATIGWAAAATATYPYLTSVPSPTSNGEG